MDKWSICRECGGEMQKYDDGEYIKYDDYERLTARVKELELMNSELGKWYSELKSAFEQQIQQAEKLVEIDTLESIVRMVTACPHGDCFTTIKNAYDDSIAERDAQDGAK